jgi:hypothetical protein
MGKNMLADVKRQSLKVELAILEGQNITLCLLVFLLLWPLLLA